MHIHTLLPKISCYLTHHSPIIIGTVIAPHGITDLFHAYEKKNMKALASIYISSFGVICLDNFVNLDYIINVFFMIASIFHFRHDMPKIFTIPQIIWSTLMVLRFRQIGVPFFLLYMCFFHVPNHYKKYIQLFKKYGFLLFFVIINLSYIFGYVTNNYFDVLKLNNIQNIGKMIVISHIIYEEIYDRKLLKNGFLKKLIPL